jgi:hypothetical protein
LITQLQSLITNANPAAGFWHFSSWQGCECLCDGSLSLYVMFFLQDFSLDRDILGFTHAKPILATLQF